MKTTGENRDKYILIDLLILALLCQQNFQTFYGCVDE